MISLTYQPNDEIPTHVVCAVTKEEAANELTLAKKFKSVQVVRKRRIAIHSGLTVDKGSFDNSINSKERRRGALTTVSESHGSGKTGGTANADQDRDSLSTLDDVFLPSSLSRPVASDSVGKSKSRGVKDQDEADSLMETQELTASGRQVFGFQSTKKNQGLKAFLKRNLEVEDQDDNDDEPPKTQPTSGKRKRITAAETKAAAKVKQAEEAAKYAKQRRVAQTISRINQISSDEEEMEHAMEEEEVDDSDDDRHQYTQRDDDYQSGDSDRETNGGPGPKKSIFESDEMGTERYFQDLHQKSRTSNNTLSKLPTLEHADFVKALKGATVKHEKEVQVLMSLYEEQFSQWYFELMAGFNLLFYGYGSKRKLLTKFATTFLTDAPLIVVNGYFPTVTVKEILNKITAGALQYTGPTGSLQEQTSFIHAYFSQSDRAVKKLYLLLHNIDGANLRGDKSQSALSFLASCPNIHLLASMDHINTGLLWDAVKAARFNWVWHDITSFQSYLTETSFENSIMVRQGEITTRGVQFVLSSLTSNGKGLFRILAQHQIDMERENGTGKGSPDVGMAFNTLFQKCQDEFLVSSAVTFRTQLTEFRDHRIVQSRKGPDGGEILFIQMGADALEGILENM